MTIQEKINFLNNEFPRLVLELKADATGSWGVLNAQQMVEHMSDSLRVANGKDPKKQLFDGEQVKKTREFMLSEKPFKENTKNIEMSEVPPAPRFSTMAESVVELEKEIADFFAVFEGTEQKTIMNPFFGPLTFDEWVHLLDKHARHHLRQFNLI